MTGLSRDREEDVAKGSRLYFTRFLWEISGSQENVGSRKKEGVLFASAFPNARVGGIPLMSIRLIMMMIMNVFLSFLLLIIFFYLPASNILQGLKARQLQAPETGFTPTPQINGFDLSSEGELTKLLIALSPYSKHYSLRN